MPFYMHFKISISLINLPLKKQTNRNWNQTLCTCTKLKIDSASVTSGDCKHELNKDETRSALTF